MDTLNNDTSSLRRHVAVASPAREKQAREQLGVTSAFHIFEASQVLELETVFGLFQVPLPAGEFLVGMADAIGVCRFGVVRFEGLVDTEGWGEC